MKINLYLLCCLILISFCTKAQNVYTVKGKVIDTVEHINLFNASVSILSAKDSILQTYKRAANDGLFSINNLNKGKLILLITYPGYADYVENFVLDSTHSVHDFGQIRMIQKAKLLADVIIKGKKAAIKIKGDTTEFNASSYTVQPNAKVEDLLKQLPGIQVDKDGKITAQGQTVNKVLVDGEEFFGDDPTLVTKNIRADMVDKVQLYDKKSDQATFTGIDDGQKAKTINIQLKADKKNGYFGKVEAGVANNDYYQGQLLFNAFKAKQKFSVYGTLGNTGKVGLGWQDNQKYGSGDNLEFGDNGNIYISENNDGDLDSFNGRYDGQGIPLARSGGVHYDTKWDNDKKSINTNYKVGSINVDGTSSNINQNNIPDSVIENHDNQLYHKFMFRQKLDVTYQIKLDTSSNLKIAIDATQKHSTTDENAFGDEDLNKVLINKYTKSLTNTVNEKAQNASIFYTHKFKKTGRTFSLKLAEMYSENNANGFLKYDFQIIKPLKDSLTDQNKINLLNNLSLNSNITYTEPISKRFSVIFNYKTEINNGVANRQSYNKNFDGSYNLFDPTYSSNYALNQVSNQTGAIINYKKGKTTIDFGTKVSNINFKQVNQYLNNSFERNFIDWQPQANYRYRFSQQKSFSIGYTGSSTQPKLNQIQPLKVNNDQLNTTIGNPDLIQSFTHNFNIFYNSYKVISDQYFSIYGNYSLTQDPISNNVVYSLNGRSTSQYVNIIGKSITNFWFGMNFGRKIEFLSGNLSFNLNANGNTYYNYVNNVLNFTKNYSYNPGIELYRYKEKKFDYDLSVGPTFNVSQSSIQTNINNNGNGLKAYFQVSVYLPANFQIGTNGNYDYTAKTSSFQTDFNRLIINSYLKRSFLKSDVLKMEVRVNDLLNQNVGFSRDANANLITQSNYTTIKRYFMFTITYDFNKMGGQNK